MQTESDLAVAEFFKTFVPANVWEGTAITISKPAGSTTWTARSWSPLQRPVQATGQTLREAMAKLRDLVNEAKTEH